MVRYRLPIAWKLGLHIVIACIITLSIVLHSIQSARSNIGDTRAIEVTGSLRMISYRLAFHVEEYVEFFDPYFRDKVIKDLTEFELLLENIRTGNPQLGLKGADTKEIEALMEKALVDWKTGPKSLIDLVLESTSPPEAHESLYEMGYHDIIYEYVAQIDRLVKEMDKNVAAKIQKNLLYDYILLLMLIITAISSFIVTRRVVTDPIHELTKASGLIAAGDFDVKVKIDSGDEMGALARSFNTMGERLKTEQQERLERERLAALAELSKSIAHEIRNPLSSIKMNLMILYSEMLGEGTKDAATFEPREHFEVALKEIVRLEDIVSSTLELTRPSALSLSRTDICEVIDAAIKVIENDFKEKTVETKVSCGEETPQGNWDTARIARALRNLLRNSYIAVGAEGAVTITVTHEPPYVKIVIEDSGPGMEPNILNRAFEPFFTTRSDATGLGLPIAKKIAERHSGDLRLESSSTDGTKATLTLKVDPDEKATRN